MPNRMPVVTDQFTRTEGVVKKQPAAPRSEVNTTSLKGAVPCIAHVPRPDGVGWCIGHTAPAPCAHWQVSSPDSQSSAGVTASVVS